MMPKSGSFEPTTASDVPKRAKNTVRTVVFTNSFDPTERQIIDVRWGKKKTVAQYLGALPEDITWGVVAAGRELTRAEWATTTLTRDDAIVLIARPEKGFGKILAMIALVIVAAVVSVFLSPLAGAIILGAGGVLINALMPDAVPKPPSLTGNDSLSSPSYGLDGPKPTAREEVPVPITYGIFRQGGNRMNYYSDNSLNGKTQTLYLQYAVSEGEIEDITDVLINDQTMATYPDIAFEKRLGTSSQQPLGWFANTVTPYQVGSAITTTAASYVTAEAVDRLRVDVTFGNGLVTVDKKSGNRSPATVDFDIRAVPVNGGPTVVFRESAFEPVVWIAGTSSTFNTGSQLRLTARVTGAAGSSPTTPYWVNVRMNASGGSLGAGGPIFNEVRSGVIPNEYVSDGNWRAGTLDLIFESGDYGPGVGFAVAVDGGTIADAQLKTNGSLTVTRDERAAFRVSFDSGPIANGLYTILVNRTGPPSTSDYLQDAVTWTTINEIKADPIAYRRTAYYALRIKLTDVFSSEPTPTVLVKGMKVNIYDVNGGITDNRWSDNPADIALDMMLSSKWGSRLTPSRVDFPAFVRWRQFCTANSLKFNGTFDFLTNFWDALLNVSRVGRASPLVSGVRWSVAVEGPAEPVMMFGVQNMIKGSFKTAWTGRQGRSNHVEVQYYDENDQHRRNSVFAVDEEALARGEPLRQATLNMLGVTNATQALKEAELQLNLNIGVQQSCTFQAFTDAIGCVVGDVIYIQHDMPKWGWADRVQSVTPFITGGVQKLTLSNALAPLGSDIEPLVPSVPMPAGDWRVLVLRPAWYRGASQVLSSSGSQIIVGGSIQPRVRRVRIAGVDYQVRDTALIGSNTTIVLDRGAPGVAGQFAEMFEIDALLEGSIAQPMQWGREVQLTAWPHGVAIEPDDQVMIGRVDKYKKPFRVMKFGYGTDQTRTLDCIEYNESVYSNTRVVVPNYSEIPATPLHVLNLRADQSTLAVTGGGVRYFARAIWELPLNDLRGHGGSKVYVGLNGGTYQLRDTAVNGIAESTVEAQLGDVVRFKVVAFDAAGFDANMTTAPVAAVTIGRKQRAPDKPTDLVAQGGIKLTSVRWVIPADPDIKSIEVWESDTNDLANAYLIDQGFKNNFVHLNLPVERTFYYWVRSVSYADEPSAFVGPASATTSYLLAADIRDGILTTAKFADSLAMPMLIDNLSVSAPNNTIALNKADGKLYTRVGGQWIMTVQPLGPDGKLTSDQIESIDAAKVIGLITPDFEASKMLGQIGPTQIQAGAVTASKLNLVPGSLNADPYFQDRGSWSVTANSWIFETRATGNGADTLGVPSAYVLSAVTYFGTGTVSIFGANRFSVTPGERLTSRIKAYNSGNRSLIAFIAYINGAGAYIIGGNIITWTPGTAAQFKEIQDVVPAGAATAYVTIYVTDGTAWTGHAAISDVIIVKPNTAAMVVDGAITTNKLDAFAVTANKMAAGSVTTEKLSVGSGNFIWNSCCTRTIDGWFTFGTVTVITGAAATNGNQDWVPTGFGGGMIRVATIPLYPNQYMIADWRPAGAAIQGIACNEGEKWQARALLGTHRCEGYIQIIFSDWQNNVLSTATSPPTTSLAGGVTDASFASHSLMAIAPAGAARVMLRLAGAGNGGTDPYLFFTKAMLSRAPVNATQVGEWAPGGVTEISGGQLRTNSIQAEVIASNQIQARHMTADSVTAGTIAAGAITAREIRAGEIRGDKMAAEEIISDSIQVRNLVIGTTKIGGDAVSTLAISDEHWGGTAGINGYIVVSDFGIVVPETRTGCLLLTWTQGYTAVPRTSRIRIDIDGAPAREFETNATLNYNSITSSLVFGPGFHQVTVRWLAEPGILLYDVNVVVLVRAK